LFGEFALIMREDPAPPQIFIGNLVEMRGGSIAAKDKSGFIPLYTLTHQEPLKANAALPLAKVCSAALLIIVTTPGTRTPSWRSVSNRLRTRTQSGSVYGTLPRNVSSTLVSPMMLKA